MRLFLYSFLAFGTLLFVVVFNCWIFDTLFHLSYLGWYINNGTLIGLVTAVIVVSWADLNKNLGLIANEPLTYVGSILQLVSLPIYALGSEMEASGTQMVDVGNEIKHVNSPLYSATLVLDLLPNIAFGMPLLLLVIVALFAWLIIIAPMQYFVFLICGAPVRILMLSKTRSIARIRNKALEVKNFPREETVPTGWWDASFTSSPVSVTSLLAALFLFVLKSII